LNLPKILVDQDFNDVEKLVSTHKGYRQQGREAMDKHPNSLTMSQKHTMVRKKTINSGLERRKTSA